MKRTEEEIYGMPHAEFVSLMALQDYCCAICGAPQADIRTKFTLKEETMELVCGRHLYTGDTLRSVSG